MTTKEKILQVSLELFALQGIPSTPLSQIAKAVGIAKPSIYNHFLGKEAIVQEMYEYYRKQAVDNISMPLNKLDKFVMEYSAEETLRKVIYSYEEMYSNKNCQLFWTLIHSEKLHDATAYQISCEETKKMVQMTKWLLEKLIAYGKLSNSNLEGKVICLAYGIQSLHIEKLMHRRQGKPDRFLDERIEKLIKALVEL